MSDDSLAEKQCADCKTFYPATKQFFYLTCRGNLNRRCKQCHVAFNKPRKQAEEYRLQQLEYSRNKYPERAEYFKRKAKEWAASNPEKRRENVRKSWHKCRKANLAKFREDARVREHKRRALKASIKSTHDPEEIWQMLEDQNHLCAYCETPLFGNYHIEHMIPLSRGGENDWTNIAISCPFCNLSKRDKTVEEFFNS